MLGSFAHELQSSPVRCGSACFSSLAHTHSVGAAPVPMSLSVSRLCLPPYVVPSPTHARCLSPSHLCDSGYMLHTALFAKTQPHTQQRQPPILLRSTHLLLHVPPASLSLPPPASLLLTLTLVEPWMSLVAMSRLFHLSALEDDAAAGSAYLAAIAWQGQQTKGAVMCYAVLVGHRRGALISSSHTTQLLNPNPAGCSSGIRPATAQCQPTEQFVSWQLPSTYPEAAQEVGLNLNHAA